MGTTRRSIRLWLHGVALLLVLGAGCADDNVSLFVEGNLAPEVTDDGCTWTPETGATFVAAGSWDLLNGSSYFLHLQVANQVRVRGNSVRSETSYAFIDRAEVTLNGADGNPAPLGGLPNPFSIPVSAAIPPSSDPGTPGLGVVTIAAVPDAYRQALADAGTDNTVLVLSIRLFGQTGGYIDLESGDWTWPVDVCQGCLLTCGGEGSMTSVFCSTQAFQDQRIVLSPAHPSYPTVCGM